MLSEIKNSLRIEHDLDDSFLLMLIDAAEIYVVDAVDAKQEKIESDGRFNLAVTLLVSSWYFNREAFTDSQKNEIPFGVTSLIHQLRGVV
ncbi:head-tail connector protein [Enterococcus sp. AZ102]|uniref:head-tail connector protein n=1 Tax=Enterococcus sp. AZ102 TaxID=2774865 RepID=UPI003F265261